MNHFPGSSDKPETDRSGQMHQEIINTNRSRTGFGQVSPCVVLAEINPLRNLQGPRCEIPDDPSELLPDVHFLVQKDPEGDEKEKEYDDCDIFDPFCFEDVDITETVHNIMF
jgi:hypothetical protein